MAKKATSPSSDVYTAILALACLAVLASAVFVTVKCINYYGPDALLKIAKAPK
ncbi:MAG: hypothetical protein ABFR90_05505 [Planctomycetota bacterium]